MEVRKKNRRKERGFTLVELMIVIAIIAILAAVAISQYSAYKNKAKAKELVGFARACAMEIVTQCEVQGNNTSVTPSSLESCAYDAGDNIDTKYLDNVDVIPPASVTCGSDFTVNATATIKGTNNKSGSVSCSYNATTNDINCSAPTVS